MKEQLVELLQQNARLTNAELAVMLGSSEAEVAAAIRELENDGVRNALLSALLQHGLEVLEISTEKRNLEQVFVKLVNQKTKHSSVEDLLQEMDDEAAQEPAAQPAEDKPAADAPAEDAAGTDGKKED